MTDTPKRNPIQRVLDSIEKFRVWTPEERQASLDKVLAELDELKNIWVFAYGSLIWQAEFDYVESLPATLENYHRALCLWSTVNRGTPLQPGLVFGLKPGGKCEGRIYKLPDEGLMNQLQALWLREMPSSSYIPKWLECDTPEGPIKALVFVMDPEDHSYVGDLSLEETLEIVMNAQGSRGPCVEYVLQTDDALKAAQIEDPALQELSGHLRRRLENYSPQR